MRNVQFAPDDDIVEICRDNVFKATFTRDNPLSQGALKKLVSAYIGREVEILAVTSNEPPVSGPRDRQIRYDIRVKFDQGELANVEMTLHPRSFEALRLEYYVARLFTSQDIQGTDKNFEDLTRTYQISLVGSRRIFPDRALVHHFEYYDRELGVSLGGRTKIIVVELEKAEGAVGKPAAELSGEEKWALFFRYARERERRSLVNELLREEEGIAMAGEALLTVSRDEIERARLESEFKYALDYQSDMVTARREGRAEGLEEGLAEGRLEVRLEAARKLKDMGLTPEQIRTALNLSPEEVAKIP